MGAIQEVRANVDMNTINIGTEYKGYDDLE